MMEKIEFLRGCVDCERERRKKYRAKKKRKKAHS